MIGHIYRIQHTQSNLCYVGSTFNDISKRWCAHKSGFKKWLLVKTNKNGNSACKMMERLGVDNFKCFLIKSYDVVDRAHLEAYETLWIKKLNTCNETTPFRVNKLYNVSYYQRNKESIKRRVREYANANKDKISARNKQTIVCACGITYTKYHKARHESSQRHRQMVN